MCGSLIALLESDLELILMVCEFSTDLTEELWHISLEIGFPRVRILENFVNP